MSQDTGASVVVVDRVLMNLYSLWDQFFGPGLILVLRGITGGQGRLSRYRVRSAPAGR